MSKNINKKKHKIFSEAFPPNEKGERQQLLSLSSCHDLLDGIKLDQNNIIYKPLTKNNLMEVKNLHKEWFPIEYDDDFFDKVFQNEYGKYFSIGAFYNINNDISNENKEIILGLALCEWECFSENLFEHINSNAIEKMHRNLNLNEKIQACLKCDYYHCVYIMTIGVLDEYRKMHIGSKIIDNIYNIALKDDICLGIYLDVIYYNKSAIKFYEKNKFEKVKEIKDYYELNGKKYDSNVYLRIITREEKDEYKIENETHFSKSINKCIIKPLNFAFNLLFKCFKK